MVPIQGNWWKTFEEIIWRNSYTEVEKDHVLHVDTIKENVRTQW